MVDDREFLYNIWMPNFVTVVIKEGQVVSIYPIIKWMLNKSWQYEIKPYLKKKNFEYIRVLPK